MEVLYTPTFVRMIGALPHALQEEAIEKIELFKDSKNHDALKVHKLKGALKNQYSFSVNYRYRIVFRFDKKPLRATLLAIGDHAVYE